MNLRLHCSSHLFVSLIEWEFCPWVPRQIKPENRSFPPKKKMKFERQWVHGMSNRKWRRHPLNKECNLTLFFAPFSYLSLNHVVCHQTKPFKRPYTLQFYKIYRLRRPQSTSTLHYQTLCQKQLNAPLTTMCWWSSLHATSNRIQDLTNKRATLKWNLRVKLIGQTLMYHLLWT